MLRDKWDSHFGKPFPNPVDFNGDDETIWALFEQIKEIDDYVSSIVEDVLRGKRHFLRLSIDSWPSKRMQESLKQKPQYSEAVRAYLRIYEELKEIVNLADEIGRRKR